MFYCCENDVIFNNRDGTGWVLEKKFGTGRVPGSCRTLEVGEADVNKEDEDDVNKEKDDETGMEKSSAGVAAP